MFYIHPWEFDSQQPRLPLPLMTRVRHYRGLRNTEERVKRLLSEFSFTALREALPRSTSWGRSAEADTAVAQ